MQAKHPEKPMINIELIPDVKFCTESDSMASNSNNFPHIPGSDLKLPQLDGTFSAIHGLDLSQHLLQLASSSNFTGSDPSDFNRCESIISFSDSNFEHDDDDEDDAQISDDECNSNDTNNKKTHPADNDQFYISSPASSTQSQPQTPQMTAMPIVAAQASTNNDVKKRNRTSVSRLQVNILRQVFRDVKNPTMKNCFSIGKEIGLTKRVIQVMMMCASPLLQMKGEEGDRKYRKMLQNYSIFD